MRNKNTVRVVSFLLAVITIITSLPLTLFNTAKASDINQEKQDFGSFKNVSHIVKFDEGYEDLCNRNITGEITFDWPDATTYLDVVFIQDFSGSFDETIAGVGETIKEILGTLDMGTDNVSGFPKDRAMIVGYKGADGISKLDVTKKNTAYTSNNLDYDIKVSELATTKDGLNTFINNYYNRDYANSGTPTIDGMVEAEKAYKNAISYDRPYNNPEYKVGENLRFRKTVYILITDGAANGAKWTNLSEKSKEMMFASQKPEAYEAPPGYPNQITGTNKFHDGIYYYKQRNSFGTEWFEYYSYTLGRYVRSTIPVSDSGWYKSNNNDYYLHTKEGVLKDYSNLSFVWTDTDIGFNNELGPKGTYYTSYNSFYPSVYVGGQYYSKIRREFYEAMLITQKDVAKKMRENGGIGQSEAGFMTAFWEDYKLLSSFARGYGNAWTSMKSEIEETLINMTGGNKDYYVNAQDIDLFKTQLKETFRKVASPSEVDNVTIKASSGISFDTSSYTLEKYDKHNESWEKITFGDQNNIDNKEMLFDLQNKKAGTYRITYHMSEDEFKASDYDPISLKMTFQGNKKDIKPTNSKNESVTKIPKNNRTDCDISVLKTISETNEDYLEGGKVYKELNKRKSEFYFDSTFTFTNALQNAKESLVIQDKIDDRLEILSAYIVAGNENAKVDGVTGATEKNILIAEMKNGTGVNHDNVPEITVKDNNITYNIPEKRGNIGNHEFKYGGHVGKAYRLAVKVRIKDTVSDEEINKMREQAGGNLEGLKGIPNISQLLIDDKITQSNEVRAVPPQFQPPKISKEIKGKDDNLYTQWYKDLLYLSKSKEDFEYKYRIKLQFPFDTSSYEKVVIEDKLDELIEINNIPDIDSYYYSGENKIFLDKQTDYKLTYNQEINKISFELINKNLREVLSEKELIFEFPVKLKHDADLSERYADITKDIRIENRSTYTINEKYKNESNKVTAVFPTASVSIEKLGDDNKPLANAQFTLYDTTDNEEGIKVEVKESNLNDGLLNFNNLLPNHTYKIRETRSPEGYILSDDTWVVEVDKQNNVSITNKDNKLDSPFKVVNKRPDVPQASKFVKGEETGFISSEDPYILSSIKEKVSYKIEVPIGSTDGYINFEFLDKIDSLLEVDKESFTVKAKSSDGELLIPINGISVIEDGIVKYSITDNFKKIENTTLVFEFNARVIGSIEEVFAKYKDGIIPNQAQISLNNQTKQTNTVNIQATKGAAKIKKVVVDDLNSPGNISDLPNELSASFDIYKVVGDQDNFEDGIQKPIENDTADLLVRNITVLGSDYKVVDNLDVGKYYLVETSAPMGYMKGEGIAHSFEITSQGGEVYLDDIIIKNIKVESPTIKKTIRSSTNEERKNFSAETLPISMGEVWEYAIDIKIPSNVQSDLDYIVTDDIPSCFEVQDINVKIKSEKEEFSSNKELEKYFVSSSQVLPDKNKIKFVLPKGSISEDNLTNKTIRIIVKTRVKPGINLLDEGFIKEDGTIPNTANLQFGENILKSMVNIKPTILRDIEFTKILGGKKFSGAEFTLYESNEDGRKSDKVMTDPFNNKPYKVFSNTSDGKFAFNNVPAGVYWLTETLAPEGTSPKYKDIKVIISDDATIKNSTEAIYLKDQDNNPITDKNQIINNRVIGVGGSKTWIGDDNNKGFTRPENIQVTLFRKAGIKAPEERVNEKIVKENSIEFNGHPWSYYFNEDFNKNPLYQYDNNGTEYIYYVKENIGKDGNVPNYEQIIEKDIQDTNDIDESLSMDLENKLKKTNFSILKLDGDSKEPIEGTTFVLWDNNFKMIGDFKSNSEGLVDFGNLSNGGTYFISERLTDVSKDYIVNSGTIKVSVSEDGKVKLFPDKYELKETNEIDDSSKYNNCYILYNYKQPAPVKKVNGEDKYHLKLINEEVTYTIDIPIKGIEDIKTISVEDNVHELMEITEGSGTVKLIKDGVEEKDITSMFRKEKTNENKRIMFESLSRDEDYNLVIPQFENSTLRFEFKARVVASAKRINSVLSKENRINGNSGSIPNKASYIINDRFDNIVETNEVEIVGDLVSIKFTKKIEGKDEEPSDLPKGESAKFDLYRITPNKENNSLDEELFRKDITTDEVGNINILGIEAGEYMLRETKSPKGYLLADDVYFKVEVKDIDENSLEEVNHLVGYKVYIGENENGIIKYPLSANAEWDSSEEMSVKYVGDIIDFKPHLPELNKMVLGKNEDLKDTEKETPTVADIHSANSHHLVPTMESEFQYIIDVVMPENIDEIYSVKFYDKLPLELQVSLDKQNLSSYMQVGKGQGNNFIAEEKTPELLDNIKVLWTVSIADRREEISLECNNENLIKGMQGKVLRINIPVKFKDSYKNKDNMTLDKNGNLINNASLIVNQTHTIESEATIKPPEVYGITFKKVDDLGKQGLAQADFKLKQFNLNGETGPSINEDEKYLISDRDGYFRVDKELKPGKYILEEIDPPKGFYIEDEFHQAIYDIKFKAYVLEIEDNSLEEKEQRIKITGINNYSNNPSLDSETKEYNGTSEDPVLIYNRRIIQIPVDKIWQDYNNRNVTRPESVKMTVQRVITNGEPDEIDFTKGFDISEDDFKPKDKDPKDQLDNKFNEMAKKDDKGLFTIDIKTGMFPGRFLSKELHRYDEKGKEYQYYIVEHPVDGYTASYEIVKPDSEYFPDIYTEMVNIINTLNVNEKVILRKVDSSDESKLIPKAEFNLYYTNDNKETVLKTIITDESGEVKLPYLLPNKEYILEEVKAPAGYLVNKSKYKINVDNLGKISINKVIDGKDLEINDQEFKEEKREEILYSVLTVSNDKTKTPTPIKRINGNESYTLKSMDKEFEYTIEASIESAEGYETFKIEDKVNDLLKIDNDSITVEADGKDISRIGKTNIENNNIIFEIDASNKSEAERLSIFKQIENRTVKLSFKAKIREEKTLEDLSNYLEKNKEGISNTADLVINNLASTSNKVYLLSKELEKPQIRKTINNKSSLSLKDSEEIFSYRVETKIPENVLGYSSLTIRDKLAKVLEIQGGIKLRLVKFDDNGNEINSETLILDKDYELSNIGNENEDKIIEASFKEGYDYTKLSGKTVVMEFNSKLKSNLKIEDLEEYKTSIFNKIEVPNLAVYELNKELGEEVKATVTPTTKPTIEKKVNNENSIIYRGQEHIRYNIDVNVPINVAGYKTFVVSDKLPDIFKSINIKTSIEGIDEIEKLVKIESLDNSIKATIEGEENISKLAGKKISFIIDCNLDLEKDLSEYVVDNKILNTADIKVNNKIIVDDTAEIKVAFGEVILTKTIEGKKLPNNMAASFDLYKQVGDEANIDNDRKISEFTTINGEINVKNLEEGKYYFVERIAPEGYILDEELHLFEISVDENAVANRVYLKVDNKVSQTPEVKKSVKEKNDLENNNFTDNLKLTNSQNKFTYKVQVPIEKVDGWTKFNLEDQVDKKLTIDNNSLQVQIKDTSKGNIEKTLTLSEKDNADEFIIEDNLIRFSYNNPTKAKLLLGKTIIMTFDASITDLNQYLIAHPNGIVINTANIDIGNNKNQSNDVTVSLPGKEPIISKTINGKTSENLRNINDSFIYNISYSIPNNINGYEKLTVTDELDKSIVVKSKDIKVYVNDYLDSNLSEKLKFEENKLELTIEKGFLSSIFGNSFESLAGKLIRIEIPAKLVEDIDINSYPNKQVENIASITLNNNNPVESNKTTVKPPLGHVILEKLADGKPLSDNQKAKFDLYKADGSLVGQYTLDRDNNKIEIYELDPGEYYFVETEAPAGFILDETHHKFIIEKDQKIASSLVINNLPKSTNIEVRKIWNDNDNAANSRPEKITFQAIQKKNNEETGKVYDKVFEVREDGLYNIENLPFADSDGSEFTYEITELVPSGYVMSKEGNTITNTLADTIDLPVEKNWIGGPTNKPEVTVILLENGEETDRTLILNEDNEFKDTFNELPAFDDSGKAITYSIKEDNISNEYENTGIRQISNTWIITNTFNIKKIDIKVNKKWQDVNGEEFIPPKEIEKVVVLLERNDGTVKLAELDEQHNWTYTFEDLEKTDKEGNDYKYTVKELPVDGFISTVTEESDNNFTIINKLSPSDKLDIPVVKIWEGKEPLEDIQVQARLTREPSDGFEDEILVLNKDNNWRAEFKDLPRLDSQGNLYTYKVSEDPIEGYEVRYEGGIKCGVVIINTPITSSNFVVKKVSEENNEKALEGATFELTKEFDSNFLIYRNSNNIGKVVFENLEAGEYKLKETKAPIGYKIDSKEYNVSVKRDNTILVNGKNITESNGEFIVTNKKINEELLAPEKFVNGVNEISLKDAYGDFTYTINATIPTLVENIESYIISDDMNDNLLIGKDDITIKVNGSINNELKDLVQIQDGNIISLDLSSKLSDVKSNNIEIIIKTRIKPEVKVNESFNTINNIGEIKVKYFDNDTVETKETNNVTVNLPKLTTEVLVYKTWANVENPEERIAEFTLDQTGEKITITGNGLGKFTNLPLTDVNGDIIEYSVTETPIEGFSSISAGNYKDGYVFTNYLNNKSGVVLQKLDKDSLSVLEGAVFELYKVEPNDKSEGNQGREDSSEAIDEDKLEEKDESPGNEILGGDLEHNTDKMQGIDKINVNVIGIEGEVIEISLLKDGSLLDDKVLSLSESNSYSASFIIDDDSNKAYSIGINPITGYDLKVESNTNNFTIIANKIENVSEENEIENNERINLSDKTEKILVNLNSIIDEFSTLVNSFTEEDNLLIAPIKDKLIALQENLSELNGLIIEQEKLSQKEEEDLSSTTPALGSLINTAVYITPDKDISEEIKDETSESKESEKQKTTEDIQEDNKDGNTGKETVIPEEPSKENEDTNIKEDSNNPVDIYKDIKIGESYTTDSNGLITIGNLEEGDYYFIEKQSPDGYKGDLSIKHSFTIKKDEPSTITVTNEKTITDLTVRKIWNSDTNSDRPEEITITLSNGHSVKLNEDNNWQYVFKNLPYKNENGEVIKYTVKEENVMGYSVDYYENSNEILVINTKNISCPIPDPKPIEKVTHISGNKIWVGDTEKDRPKFIKVKLINETIGKEVAQKIITKEDNWKYNFENIPSSNDIGELYSYRILEEVPENYTASYKGYDIINTKIDKEKPIVEYQTIKGKKSWSGDSPDERPDSVVINLIDKQTGKVVTSTLASKENNWLYSFNDIIKVDETGKVHEYKIEEIVPNGYSVTYNGFDLLNKKEKLPDNTETDTPIKPEEKPTNNHEDKPQDNQESKVSEANKNSKNAQDTKNKPEKYDKNPNTLVEGYAKHISAIILAGLGIILADKKRRKSNDDDK